MDDSNNAVESAIALDMTQAGWNYPPLIINAALTGNIPGKKDSFHVPITPDEIVLDAVDCYRHGARIVHLHARDRQGDASWEPGIFQEIIGRIREECPELIVCASTSGRKLPRDRETRRSTYVESQVPTRHGKS